MRSSPISAHYRRLSSDIRVTPNLAGPTSVRRPALLAEIRSRCARSIAEHTLFKPPPDFKQPLTVQPTTATSSPRPSSSPHLLLPPLHRLRHFAPYITPQPLKPLHHALPIPLAYARQVNHLLRQKRVGTTLPRRRLGVAVELRRDVVLRWRVEYGLGIFCVFGPCCCCRYRMRMRRRRIRSWFWIADSTAQCIGVNKGP